MSEYIIPDLQLFADGGDGAGATGETGTADAAQDANARLLELGVPADKLRRRANRADTPIPQGAIRVEPRQDAAAVTPKSREGRPSWDELMADPEYNRQMQSVVQERLKKSKGAEEAMDKLSRSVALLAQRYGLDPENPDYGALGAVLEREIQPAQATQQAQSPQAPQQAQPPQTPQTPQAAQATQTTLQPEQLQAADRARLHLDGLRQQGEALKRTFPGFDLQRELKNPAFVRMTAPGVGVSVEDAFYAVHRNEIQNAAMQATAQRAAEKLSNSIQANALRPREAGAGAQAPSTVAFDYSKASPAQREAIKKRIRDAAARGEKVYPGNGVRTRP